MSTSQTWITVIHLPFSSTVWPPRHSGSALSAFIAARNSCKSKGCKRLCTRLKDTEREFWRNQRNANMFFPLPSATFYSPRVWRRQLLGQDVGRILLIWVLHSFFWKQIEKGQQHLICKGSHAWQIKAYMIHHDTMMAQHFKSSTTCPNSQVFCCFATLGYQQFGICRSRNISKRMVTFLEGANVYQINETNPMFLPREKHPIDQWQDSTNLSMSFEKSPAPLLTNI